MYFSPLNIANWKAPKRGKAKRRPVARPACANATVNFLPTDWLSYCHISNDL